MILHKVLFIFLFVIIAFTTAQADRRKYVWTYQTTTSAPNSSELEFYQTGKQNSGQADKWEYRIELEQGISPKFDIAVYQIFSQTEGASLKWDAFQFRGRYRIGLAGTISFDPVIYMEYRRKLENQSGQNKFELKLLLGKDFKKINISLNPLIETMWAGGYKPYQEVGVDAGVSYAPSFRLSLGIESISRKYFYSETNREDKFKTAVGPTVSYAVGDNFYTVGVAWGVNKNADDIQFRFIMGIGL